MNIKDLTRELVSRNTEEAKSFALGYLSKLSCECSEFCGGVIAVKKGRSDFNIMLDAHIDEICLVVTSIDEKGFLKVAKSGGVDRRILENAKVTVCMSDGAKLKGIICTTPPHLLKEKAKKTIEFDDVAVDIGLSHDEAVLSVMPGDKIYFDGDMRELLGNRVTAKSLDDRAGCAAVINAFERLCEKDTDCTVTLILSDLEEINAMGAMTGAFRSDPDEAIAVDVSFATYPGISEPKAKKMSGGAMLGISPVLDSSLAKRIRQAADFCGASLQNEVMAGRTGTNADEITVCKSGVKCGLLSIPQRNMHTPVETVDIDDIQAVADIIFTYVAGRKA